MGNANKMLESFFHDHSCSFILLVGQNFRTKNYLSGVSSEQVWTGAFSPFGVPSYFSF
ncbi:hypothetical protein BLGI_504 [Brevibacillus laterosporus GI-9]|nr:hypothetical protein BLGI_504 [Brevibacillus laterosporus GI-9]